MFEAFYKKYLAKRLLLGKSSSYELEKNMLSRLKTECGSGFTSKLEGMFQDIELSKDIMIAYQDSTAMSLRTGDVPLPEFSIHILTNGFWPSSPQLEGLRLPSSLTEIMRSFENFYNAKYQGRRLTWVHNLQRCVVVARFQKGKKELELTLFQVRISSKFCYYIIYDHNSTHYLNLQLSLSFVLPLCSLGYCFAVF